MKNFIIRRVLLAILIAFLRGVDYLRCGLLLAFILCWTNCISACVQSCQPDVILRMDWLAHFHLSSGCWYHSGLLLLAGKYYSRRFLWILAFRHFCYWEISPGGLVFCYHQHYYFWCANVDLDCTEDNSCTERVQREILGHLDVCVSGDITTIFFLAILWKYVFSIQLSWFDRNGLSGGFM